MAVFAEIMTVISGFGILCALIVRIGNPEEINQLMHGLVMAMTGLLPFLLITMSVLSVLKTGSDFFLGMAGFTMLLGLVGTFGMLMAYIGKIGNVENTVTIMESLTKTMNGLLPFLLAFSIVLSFLGMLGPMILIGNAMFAILLTSIAGFAALLAAFAMIGDVDNTIKLMESLAESMQSLTTTMLLITAVGALGIPAIAGVAIIEGFIVSILGLFTIIGTLEVIQNAVLIGINLMLFTCESIRTITEIMSGIDLNGIMIFVTALQMLSSVNLIGLTKLALVNTSLAVASSPLIIIGTMKKQIEAGCDTALKMIESLVTMYNMTGLLGNLTADSITQATNDTLKIADAMVDYASLYTVKGLSDGLVNNRSKAILESGAVGMAAIIEEKFRNVMGIHSDSDLFIELAHYMASGNASGMTDAFSTNLLTDATTSMGNVVNSTGISVFGNAGTNSANSFLTGFVTQLVTGSKDMNIEAFFSETSSAVGKAGRIQTSRHVNINGRKNTQNYQARLANNIANYRSEKEFLEAQLKAEEEAAANSSDSLDYGNIFTKLLKELEASIKNLGSMSGNIDSLTDSMGGLGSSASSAAKSTDELTNKIDNLMDKYEEMWEDAKTNANKDLFKGVDKQGDDFLDSVQDIMDQYENIFKSAVERTNNQDLFAEVKENDESFAPDTLLNNLEDQVDQINELNTIISSLGGRIADNNLRAAISNMDVDDLPELRAMFRMSDSQLAEYEKLYQKKVQGNQNKIQNELTGSLSQITGQYTNIAEYVATDASTNMLLKNLQAQIDQLNEYNATVGSLMNRISDLNLREAIAHMGVDSLDELKMLNSMTSEQLDEYVEMYNAKIGREAQRIRNELSTELSTVLNQPIDIGEFYEMYRGAMSDFADMLGTDDATTQAGKNVGSTLVNGASSGISESGSARTTGRDYSTNVADGMVEKDVLQRVEANANMVLDTILNVFTNAYDDLRNIGEEIINKICAGIDLGRRGAGFTNTLSTICFTISNALVVGSDFRWLSTGEAITNGITRGMNSSRAIENLENSARAIAAKAVNAVRQELQIASPSKVFMQIGRFVDEGFAQGLKDYSSLATIASEDMATNSLSAVQEAIMQLSGMLDGSIDLNPTITPTLDLSEINARSSALSDMFNGRQVAIAARADAQQAEMISQLGELMAKQPTVTNNTFNQTNNSPKALSRTEIYRQSKTAFSQFASAIS